MKKYLFCLKESEIQAIEVIAETVKQAQVEAHRITGKNQFKVIAIHDYSYLKQSFGCPLIKDQEETE